jgi:hypothetical protein
MEQYFSNPVVANFLAGGTAGDDYSGTAGVNYDYPYISTSPCMLPSIPSRSDTVATPHLLL